MPKIIGYMRCPICGRKTDIRENKNGILYSNCDFFHQSKLNRQDSSAAKEAIAAGKQWNNGLVYLYPNERKIENGNNGTVTTGTAEIGRRVDGQFASNTAADNGTTDTGTSADTGDEWDGECGMF